MSHEFNDYKVLGIVDNCGKNSCYRVEEKNTGRVFVWEAVDYGLLPLHGKALLQAEAKKLRGLSHPNLICCYNEVDQKETSILYLVKEFCTGSVAALVKKCRSTNSYIDELFAWRILYQAARAAQATYALGTTAMQLDFTPTGVKLDDDGNVRLDYQFVFQQVSVEKQRQESGSTKEYDRRKSEAYSLGCLLYELVSLQPPTMDSKQESLPTHYSHHLRKLISMMRSNDKEKRPTIEGILYHPALISHIVKGSFQHLAATTSSESASVNSESTVESCPRCHVIEERTRDLIRRENIILHKEQELKAKELKLRQKQKQDAKLEREANEKMTTAEVYMRKINIGTGALTFQRPRQIPLTDLDSSSYSADPGESFLQPTAAKLDPSKIIRPLSFTPSVSSRRSVRFETIPELEESSAYKNECRTWLETKRMKFKALKKKKKSKRSRECDSYDKENQKPPMISVNNVSRSGSLRSLPCSTQETQDGVLETFFSLKL